ncbi:MAG: 16S rRNA (guanine(527)-N(7))-methyltransferase RsmG [Chitinophagales bacterium]|nr:16S rRNA (guanine(527)-N(7))-methyltransferase RsmG [Chitinophagales bacterium]MDW8272927.1 16S rRNA (guanine(527)-N(7))-methyltransferase RsmG [Chitinophagales bacterium]
MEILQRHFPELSSEQVSQFSQLQPLYEEWNSKINVISRKDIPNFPTRHLLHSLSIAKFILFKKGTKIMDLGTGGGLPGIPLAIFFPECRFHLVDSVGKKIMVAKEIAARIGLKNVFFFHARAESMNYKYDFIVSRAVAPVAELLQWSKGKISPHSHHAISNGLICLKGGNLEDELREVKKFVKIPLSKWFEEPDFEGKYLIHIPTK